MSDKPIEGHAYIMSMANEIISLRAERDALRALLREARDALSWVWPKEMLARIDAALNKEPK